MKTPAEAIVRTNYSHKSGNTLDITVVKVLVGPNRLENAIKEVARLNKLNGDENTVYFRQTTRIFEPKQVCSCTFWDVFYKCSQCRRDVRLPRG